MPAPLPEPQPVDLQPTIPVPYPQQLARGGTAADEADKTADPHNPAADTDSDLPLIPPPAAHYPPVAVEMLGVIPTRQRLPDSGIAGRFVSGRIEHTVEPFLLIPADPGRGSISLVNRSTSGQTVWLGYSRNFTTAVGSYDLQPGEQVEINNSDAVYALVSAIGAELRWIGDRDSNLAR